LGVTATVIAVVVIAGCADSAGKRYDPYMSDEAVVEQSVFAWPRGKRVAVSLTFDDARLSQADVGLAVLDRHDVKATFYVLPGGVEKRLEVWKKAVAGGHEIGNHTLVHPCSGNFTWSRAKALEDYDLAKITDDIDAASRRIETLLGVKPTTFAYPCGQTFVGRGVNTQSYVPVVAERFIVGRGAFDEIGSDPAYCDLSQATGISIDEMDFTEAKALIEQAHTEGRWLILFAHEVGDKARQTVPTETLEAICRYAEDPANGVWIDTVEAIAKYVVEHRQNN